MKVRDLMEKEASVVDDIVGNWGSTQLTNVVVPGVGSLSSGIGGLAGMLNTDKLSEEEKKKIIENRGYSYIPGIGGYRLGRRLSGVSAESKEEDPDSKPFHNMWAESFGPVTSTILPAVIGAGLGSKITGSTRGAVGGAATGGALSLLAMLGGAAKAGLTDRRTKEEQADMETGKRALQKLLIPGVSSYDAWKRIGRSRDWDDEIG
jgi:hypothetical protein